MVYTEVYELVGGEEKMQVIFEVIMQHCHETL